MNLGAAIKLCRTRRKLSQSELSKRCDCSVSYLSMLENGLRDPALSVVERIASGLGIPVQILFFLASDRDELTGMDKELAGQLARLALELLSSPDYDQALV